MPLFPPDLSTQVNFTTALVKGIHALANTQGLGVLSPLGGGASQAAANARAELFRTACLTHGTGVGTFSTAGEHLGADTANNAVLAAVPAATSEATCATLTEAIYTWSWTHAYDSGVHFRYDGVLGNSTISVDPPVTLADTITDLNDLLVNLLTHFNGGPVYGNQDIILPSGQLHVIAIDDAVVANANGDDLYVSAGNAQSPGGTGHGGNLILQGGRNPTVGINNFASLTLAGGVGTDGATATLSGGPGTGAGDDGGDAVVAGGITAGGGGIKGRAVLTGRGVVQTAPNGALVDGDLANGQLSFYLTEAGNVLNVKVKYSSGAVKTLTVPLPLS